ncbi:TIGR04053 family radical SAM/SPASM domain-containing protein [Propionimicrobium sp. PCR01-08-3]|uniref:TIGR04053 family radical SAM/SPASM domain-containing protein n=1 Tax=Propionimicrobium sp. PCR01-08-3 TaxID=3052086 RepID=UPI00255CE243|nr:TIGR04053 family radical SAM/SPASM domain-containing protein [Propionimicrobium sp. PCR01-08-3]WIY81631.1 TIGR04053 family radical SAM/SPASM domain-containing protein [Propionimicrobium sp. PCR01-08-3]
MAGHPGGIGSVKPINWAYDRAPMIIYWEMTNACGLACKHCRATAMPDPAPDELNTDESLRLLDSIAEFGKPLPHIVMTGGDPLRRPDLELLVNAAIDRGIGVSLAPAVTPLLTAERIAWMKDLGIGAISLSLDASNAHDHDALRQVDGTFDATLEALRQAAAVKLPVQVNTLVSADNADDLEAMYGLLSNETLMQWSLFFLISVGRGTQLTELDPGEAERLLSHWGARSATAPFRIKTTEAMQYRRILAQRLFAEGKTREQIEAGRASAGFGIRDGNGVVFISHQGKVYPSGFLPIEVGSVREQQLADIYQNAPLMRQLRRPEEFHGRCGVCEFHRWCGGSRARAWARTGDPLATDPMCPYQPGGRYAELMRADTVPVA